ncbi:MAG: HlyD family efflux transporter periplasmic adaptor subunit [Chitinophagales bacterium]|nr:HlyD family efflux transporter periplasmic adaptor subunit [Chitinophagales bacterium]
MNFNKIPLSLILLFSAVLISCHSEKEKVPVIDVEHTVPKEINQVVGIGRVRPLAGIVELAVEENGIVQDVRKQEGDSVKKGEVIIILNTSNASLKKQQINDQIRTQNEQIKVDETGIQELNFQLSNLNKTIKTSEALLKKGAETKENLDALYTDKKVLESKIEQSKKVVSVGQTKVRELQTQEALAENIIGKSIVKAPSDGVLLTQDAKVGAALHALEAFASFAPDSPWIVEAEVDEMFANRLQIGQKVNIHYIGQNEVISTGTISSLSPYLSNKSLFSDEPAEKQDRRVRRLKVKIDHTDNLLLNSKVECNIQIQ